MKELLQNEHFTTYARDYDCRPLTDLVNKLSGSRMRRIRWLTVKDIQRISHSDEYLTVNAVEGINEYGVGVCEMFMVSHRWFTSAFWFERVSS